MTIDELLEQARSRIDRVAPEDLADEIADGALIADIRPADSRARAGEIPGATPINRNVLEWRLSPSSDFREFDVTDGRKVIVVCEQGYQSSLAAAILLDLGVPGATDLIGGYEAYATLSADQ